LNFNILISQYNLSEPPYFLVIHVGKRKSPANHEHLQVVLHGIDHQNSQTQGTC
jgi:hypothetical protein